MATAFWWSSKGATAAVASNAEQKKRLDYADKDHSLTRPTPDVVFIYAEAYLENGKIALQGIRL
jgi:hypothetical protein